MNKPRAQADAAPQQHVGMIISADTAEEYRAQGKQWELRSLPCTHVKKGGLFYIVERCGRMGRLVGTAVFSGTRSLPKSERDCFQALHLVPMSRRPPGTVCAWMLREIHMHSIRDFYVPMTLENWVNSRTRI